MSIFAPGRLTIPEIASYKSKKQRIVALTAYDYSMATIVDSAGVDLILVGDSLGSVVQGHETTLPVTLDDMIYHCRAVSRGVRRALLIGDMPFMSYQVSVEQTIAAAGRMIKEGFCQGVKLEGGSIAIAARISALTELDIPVLGHLGLTPQSVHRMGGYKVQGRDKTAREKIMDEALRLEDAGVFSIVLECIPSELAATITERLSIPTIGIGSGEGDNTCDGKILVINDLVGLTLNTVPKFVRPEANIASEITLAIKRYAAR